MKDSNANQDASQVTETYQLRQTYLLQHRQTYRPFDLKVKIYGLLYGRYPELQWCIWSLTQIFCLWNRRKLWMPNKISGESLCLCDVLRRLVCFDSLWWTRLSNCWASCVNIYHCFVRGEDERISTKGKPVRQLYTLSERCPIELDSMC